MACVFCSHSSPYSLIQVVQLYNYIEFMDMKTLRSHISKNIYPIAMNFYELSQMLFQLFNGTVVYYALLRVAYNWNF